MSQCVSRRKFLQFTIMGAVGAAIAACAPKPAEPPVVQPTAAPGATAAPAATVAPAGPVTLQWGMYDYEPWIIFLKELFAKYKAEKDPNVTVELVTAPWDQYWAKLEAQAAAGTPIHATIVEPQYYIPWLKRDLVLDLKPYVDTVDPTIFYDSVVCAHMVNTETWFGNCQSGGNVMAAFPGNGTCWVCYLNMALLKEAGLDYPQDSWTWDDFRTYAVALTKDANGKHPGEAGFDRENIVQWGVSNSWFGDQKNMKSFIWHAGGRRWSDDQTVCGFTEEPALKAIKYMYEIGVELACAPLSASFEGIAQPFLTGKIGMHLTGSWNVDPWATDLTDWEFDIARLPVGPGGPTKRLSHTGYSNALCMFKNSANQEKAWELFRYALMTKDGSAFFGRAGVPTVKAAAEDKEWMDRPGGQHKPKHREIQLVCMAKEPGNAVLEPLGLNDADMLNVIANEMPNLALGRAKPDEWAKTICDQIQAVWEKAKTTQ